MTKSKTTRSPLLAIYLTVFLDMLGVTIIIPVLPALFFDAGTTIFEAEMSLTMRSVLYGLLLASYPLMQFFGAPALGALSDRHGRKPVLTAALVGTLVGYLLFGTAILTKNIWLLFFSRMLPGFTGGNISIVLSAIADVSDEQSRAKNFGLVGAAFGLGFILGPTIGGILADNSVVSWFDHATPFWFTAGLTLLNILLVRIAFPETLRQSRQMRITLLKGFENIGRSFQAPNLRKIFIVVLFMSLGFTFFTQFFSVYLIQKFSFSEKNIGFLYGWIGVWLVITQAMTVRRLSRFFQPAQLIRVTAFFMAIAIGMLLLPADARWFYLLNPIVATFHGITAPNLTAFVSQQARPDQQGEILGINQSMQSLGQAIPPLIAGYMNAVNVNLPLAMAAVLIFTAWLLFFVNFGRKA
jgi:DHA1 family tetracycline resistance protein-like MFS transporter